MKQNNIKSLVAFVITTLVLILLYNIENKRYRWACRENILEKCPMNSVIGKIDSARQINARGTNEGYLAFGPYIPLEKGTYVIKYKISLNNLNYAENLSKIVGYCDLNIEGHAEPLYHIDITAGIFQKNNPNEIALRFFVPDGRPRVEFRVYQFGGNNLSLVGLSLTTFSIKNLLLYNTDEVLAKVFYLLIAAILFLVYLNFICRLFDPLPFIQKGINTTLKEEFIVCCLFTILFIAYYMWTMAVPGSAKVAAFFLIVWFIKLILNKNGYVVSFPKLFTRTNFVLAMSITAFIAAYFTFGPYPGGKYGNGWFNWFDQSVYYRLSQDLCNFKIVAKHYIYGLGYSFIGAPFLKVYPTNPFLIPNLLMFVMNIFFYYKVAQKYLNNNLAFLAILLLIFGTQFTDFSSVPWNNLVPTAGLGFLTYLVVVKPNIGTVYSILIGLSLGWVFSARYADVFFLFPVALYIYYLSIKKDRKNVKYFLLMALSAFVVFLAVLATHKYAYGEFFKTPYTKPGTAATLTTLFKLSNLPVNLYSVFINPHQFQQVTPHPLDVTLLGYSFFFILAITGFTYLLLNKRDRIMTVIFISMMLGMIFYGSYFVTDTFNLKFWNLRFFLMWYPILTIMSVLAISKLSTFKNILNSEKKALIIGVSITGFLLILTFTFLKYSISCLS